MAVRDRGRRLLDRLDSPGRKGRPGAVYARVLDGEHLWLAVRAADRLALKRPDGTELPVPVEIEDDAGHPVAVARFPIATALADLDEGDLAIPVLGARGGADLQPVRHHAERRPGPMIPAPTTRDGRWQFSVSTKRRVVVIHRRAAQPAVRVLRFEPHPDGVLLHLDLADAVAGPDAGPDAGSDPLVLALEEDGGPRLAEIEIRDGTAVIGTVDGLAAGETVRMNVAGRPVMRQRNLVGAPHPATLLPPLPGDLQLRWGGAGRLAVHRRTEEELET